MDQKLVSFEKIVLFARNEARLSSSPYHGERHWLRVALAGLKISEKVRAADPVVAVYFGLLHDVCRVSDGFDIKHGPRASSLIGKLAKGGGLMLTPDQLHLLRRACATHTHGITSDDPTIGVCWDADRLDLRRFGYSIDVNRMSTAGLDCSVIAAHVDRLENEASCSDLLRQAVGMQNSK
jgi:uncharacterized protein